MGLLFVAHGCGHAATDFFPRSDRCPTCAGLPESPPRRQGAQRRLAVAAVSGQGGCWRPSLVPRACERSRGSASARRTAPSRPRRRSRSARARRRVRRRVTPRDARRRRREPDRVRAPARATDDARRARGGAPRVRGPRDTGGLLAMTRDAATAQALTRAARTSSVGVPVRVTELAPQPVGGAFFHRKLTRFAAATSGGDSEAAALGLPTLEPAVRLAESARMAAALRDAGLLDSEACARTRGGASGGRRCGDTRRASGTRWCRTSRRSRRC